MKEAELANSIVRHVRKLRRVWSATHPDVSYVRAGGMTFDIRDQMGNIYRVEIWKLRQAEHGD